MLTGASSRNPLQRIQDKSFDADGCREWAAGCDRDGYPTITIDGQKRTVYKWLYEHVKGPVPAGLELDHVCHDKDTCVGGKACRHRKCINVDHLEAVPHAENMRRSVGNREKDKTHCPSGHPYNAENTQLNNGRRVCRTCARASVRAYRQRKAA